MKRVFFILLSHAALLLAAYCLRPAPHPPRLNKAVYLINGALGDNGFFDSGKVGMDAIASKYGVETRTIEAGYDANKYEPSLQAAAGLFGRDLCDLLRL